MAAKNLLPTASDILKRRQEGLDLQHAQNLKNQQDFQNWYAGQADSAQEYLTNRTNDVNSVAQQRIQQATAAMQGFQTQANENMLNNRQQEFTRAIEGVRAGQAVNSAGMVDSIQNVAAQRVAAMRNIGMSRVADYGQAEQMNYQQQKQALENARLEDAYKQQQFQIDAATAEALGAKSAAEMELNWYRAETDRQAAMTTAEYNAAKLEIDRQYKQGLLSNKERRLQLDELNSSSGGAAVRKDAEAARRKASAYIDKITKEMVKNMPAANPFAGANKEPNWATASTDIVVPFATSIWRRVRTEYPSVPVAGLLKVLGARFGPRFVQILNTQVRKP